MEFRTLPRIPALIAVLAFAGAAHAQSTSEPYQPKVGQAGKDVVWVPTPAEMVERMLDLAPDPADGGFRVPSPGQ